MPTVEAFARLLHDAGSLITRANRRPSLQHSQPGGVEGTAHHSATPELKSDTKLILASARELLLSITEVMARPSQNVTEQGSLGVLTDAPRSVSPNGMLKSKTGRDLPVRMRKMLDSATDIYARNLSSAIGKQHVTLDRLRGIPVEFNVLRALRLETKESLFRDLLLWLLSPEGDHGLGDHFLRRFLGRLGVTLYGSIFSYSKGLPAVAIREFQWRIPKNKNRGFRIAQSESTLDVLDPSNPESSLRVDLLLIVHGLIVPIELKVESMESQYWFDDCLWNQAALYVKHLSLMVGKSSNPEWTGLLHPACGPDAPEWLRMTLQGEPRIVGCLVHSLGKCRHAQNPSNREYEHDSNVRHLNWLDVNEILADLLWHHRLGESQRNLIQSFRTAILENSDDGTIVQELQGLRLRVDELRLAMLSPLRTHFELQRITRRLGERDPCCKEL